MIKKEEWYQTIFGPEWEVIVYPEKGQTRTHISLLVHPDDIEKVREILRNNGKVSCRK